MKPILRRITAADVTSAGRSKLDRQTMDVARVIVDDVRARGLQAVQSFGRQLGDLDADSPLLYSRAECNAALERIDGEVRKLLERTADRIRTFANAQRESLLPVRTPVAGGEAGHYLKPVQRAGCYAPSGRYPLPSSVLMAAVTADVAEVEEIWVATPRPSDTMLAAAAVGNARGVLAVGGAQAIAGLAYGCDPVPACDVVVGPGNRFVTAAKKLVAGDVGIDMLAGPTELVILADASADADTIAIDLLAQAEHDPDAVPVLITWDMALVDAVEAALQQRLDEDDRAQAAFANGGAIVVRDGDAAVEACDWIAPEHLQIMSDDANALAQRVRNFGAVFIGADTPTALGDYGTGPNHVLPTSRTARFASGLSVMSFVRTQTWIRIDSNETAREATSDAAAFAEIEGLKWHAASLRSRQCVGSSRLYPKEGPPE